LEELEEGARQSYLSEWVVPTANKNIEAPKGREESDIILSE
jgi:hypothetical protein